MRSIIEMVSAIAHTMPPPAQREACMICRQREWSVPITGGGEVCDWCAMERPIEMLPEGWSL